MIDAAIPLQGVAPQVTPPMQLLAQAGNLQAQQQEGQLRGQAIQQGQLALNRAGQDSQDDADVRAALAAGTKIDPATGQPTLDRTAAFDTLTRLNPTKALQLKTTLDSQDAAAATAKQVQYEAKLKAATATNEFIGSALAGVTDQVTYTNVLKHAKDMGIDVSQYGPQYDPQIVARAQQQALTVKEQLAQHNTETTQAETARKNQADEANTAARDANTALNQKAERKQEGQRIGIEGAKLNLDRQKFQAGQLDNGGQLTGDSYLQTLPPGMQAQVKAMANGDIPLPPPGTRAPQAQALRQAVFAYDPTVTQARYTGKQSFLTGKDATAVVQLGTALKHADNALANSAKVGTAPLLGMNATGADAAYNKDVQYLTGEVGKLVTGGALTVDEGKKLTSGLDSMRQGVRDTSIKESLELLSGKTSALFQKYKAATGQDLPTGKMFDADTQARMAKYGISAPTGGGGISVQAPNGKTYNFPDADAAAKFKASAGIQ